MSAASEALKLALMLTLRGLPIDFISCTSVCVCVRACMCVCVCVFLLKGERKTGRQGASI